MVLSGFQMQTAIIGNKLTITRQNWKTSLQAEVMVLFIVITIGTKVLLRLPPAARWVFPIVMLGSAVYVWRANRLRFRPTHFVFDRDSGECHENSIRVCRISDVRRIILRKSYLRKGGSIKWLIMETLSGDVTIERRKGAAGDLHIQGEQIARFLGKPFYNDLED
jgi:hypothetical protein